MMMIQLQQQTDVCLNTELCLIDALNKQIQTHSLLLKAEYFLLFNVFCKRVSNVRNILKFTRED